ncbi:MAG TPA: cytochrome c biogenesis protein CcdA [Polyangia bacterium]|nr:cytochrome c biogenesis protein CcdA [Polyangia bacterium]
MDFQAALGHGLPFAFGLVFLGGLLTAATPCVFPLIPITVSIFGAKQAARKRDAALLSGCYVLGIAAMYTGLGVAAAATGRAFGGVMANPWVIGVIAAIFVAFAASMFGAYDIALPTSWQNRLSQVGGKGVAGAFAMGLVAGVIAAPCTGPVLGAVLAYVATTQKLAFGGSLLFTYALGMGLPFFLVGTFAIALPKSGPWMDAVKSVFGILLLNAAAYFLKDVWPALKTPIPTATWFRVTALAAVAVGLALGAVHLSFHSAAREQVRKAVGVILVVAGVHAGAVSLTTSPIPAYSEEQWAAQEAGLLAQARSEHRPVMIDFGADWCAACKELELKTYPDPLVAGELKRFAFFKVDDRHATASEKYGALGLPYVVFFDSRGQLRKDLTVQGYKTPQEFVAILRAVD